LTILQDAQLILPPAFIWQALAAVPDKTIPPHWVDWLSDRGSLTQRLIEASANRFTVEVLDQVETMPTESEAQALNIDCDAPVYSRQVLLLGNGEPWVFARSIMPLSTLTGRLEFLRDINSQPLGALLFKDPSMTRAPVEAAFLPTERAHLPDSLRHIKGPLWGRRSVFRLDQKPLLVSEIFLPEFKPYNQYPSLGFST
jgi:chorismate--pyruvate lyase